MVVGGTAGNLLYDTGGTVGELAILPVAHGGTGTATPSIVGGTNVTVTGSWPNQTISASGGGGGSSINVKQAGSTVVSGLTDLNFVQGAAVAASGTQANVTIPTNYFASGAPSTGSTPSLDGTATSQWSGSATGTVTVTTTQVNDVVVLLIGCEQNAALQTVSSVASAHLTFARRGGFNGQPGSGNYQSFEIWWAPAASILTSEVITITLSAATDDAAVVAFAVHGAANISAPWDTGTLPVITTGNPAAAPTFTTNQAHDFIFAASFSSSPTYDTSAWTALASVGNGAGTNYAYISSFYEIVSALQAAASASLTSTSSNLKIRLVDAITGDVVTTYVTGDRYYDTSTTPYTEYVYASGTWHQVGSSGGSSITVQQAGSTVVTGLTVLNFASGATVSASGTTANVTVAGGGSGGGSTLIGKHTCGAGETTFTFSSIPTTFEDLELVVVGNYTGSGVPNANVTINGLSSAIYSTQRAYWDSNHGTASSDQTREATAWSFFPAFPGTGTSSNYPTGFRVRFYDYQNTNFYKAGEFQGLQKYQSNDGDMYLIVGSILADTTAAISSITITIPSNTWAAGTTFSLIGIGGSSSSTPAVVQLSNGVRLGDTSSSGTMTLSTGATAGNLIAIVFTGYSGSSLSSVPTGFGLAVSYGQNNQGFQVYLKTAAGGETSLPVTISGDHGQAIAYEISGSTAVSSSAAWFSSGGSSWSSSVYPSLKNALVIAAFEYDVYNPTVSVTSPAGVTSDYAPNSGVTSSSYNNQGVIFRPPANYLGVVGGACGASANAIFATVQFA